MPSTIPITAALRNGGVLLLHELGEKAEALALEAPYHVISTWVSFLLQHTGQIDAGAVAAQHAFSTYEVNSRWLNAFNALCEFGGQGRDAFVVTLYRYYLFNLPQIEDLLWQQYTELQENVLLETGEHLPETWAEWEGPMQAFMDLFQESLVREESTYELLFKALAARELAAVPPGKMLSNGSRPARALIPAAASVDDAAALSAYLDWYVARFGRIETRIGYTGEHFSLRLDDVFVPRRLVDADPWAAIEGRARQQQAVRRDGKPSSRRKGRHARATPGGDESATQPVTYVLEEARRVHVLAGAGDGKTTLLRHLAFQYADLIQHKRDEDGAGQHTLLEANHRLPVYVHLADYAESANLNDEALLDYILRSLEADEVRDAGVPLLLERLLDAGKCLFLLDGLDSVIGDFERLLVVARVGQLASRWCAGEDGNQVLVASRPADDLPQPLAPGFTSMRLAELTQNETKHLLARWALSTERARHPMMADDDLYREAEAGMTGLVKHVNTEEARRYLAANPLMLRLTAELYFPGAFLTTRRAGLLHLAAEALIREWRLARGPTHSPQVQEVEALDLLGHLAYWLQCYRASGTASEQEATETLGAAWRQRHPEASQHDVQEAIDDFLAKVRHRGGLLAEVRPRLYAFEDPSMQEYFAARHLVSRYLVAARRVRQHLHDPRWEQVVRLAVGFVALDSPPDASDLLQSALLALPDPVGGESFGPSPFEDYLQRDLFVGGGLLADGVEANPALAQQVVARLVDLWLLGEGDSAGRFDAIFRQAGEVLAGLDGTVAAQAAMRHALAHAEDNRTEVRAYVADALTFWPSLTEYATETLLALGGDPSPLVRSAAAGTLQHAASLTPKAHVLLLTLVSDPDTGVREAARRSLRASGPVPESNMRMWVRLLHDEDAMNRMFGALLLQRVGTLPPMVVGELVGLLSDEEPKVRSAVARTLATIESLPNEALTAICRAIDQADPEVRLAGIEALARPVELPDDVVAQVIGWSREADPQVRLMSTRALDTCHNQSDAVLEALMNRAGDEAANVRQTAIEALGRKGAGSQRVEHLLLHLALDGHTGTRIGAATALGYLGDLSDEGQTHLANLLLDMQTRVREATMRSAARLRKPYDLLVRRLLDMTTNEAHTDVLWSARTLTHIDGLPGEALLRLAGMMSAYPDELATHIAACLERHSPLGADVVYLLLDQLGTTPESIRHLIIGLLGHSMHAVPGVAEELLGLLGDHDQNVRSAAVASLAHARDIPEYGVESLFDTLKDPTPDVQLAAAVTLARLSQTLPHLGWDAHQMEHLADRLYHLLGELPAQAAWNPKARTQNAVLDALSGLAPRYGPEL